MLNSTRTFELYLPVAEEINSDVDIYYILHLIGDNFVSSLTWGVGQLEWYDEGELVAELNSNLERQIVVSGNRLLERARKVYQTLGGIFVGYPSKVTAQKFLQERWTRASFENSPAQLMIYALEGTGFEVYLRSKSLADQFIQHFQDVQLQAPADFLVY